MTISLTDLKAKRAAMTQGEWRLINRQGHIDVKDAWHTVDNEAGQVVVNTLGGHWPESIANATGIVATHNATDVLIAVAEAAWADKHTRCNCNAEYGHLARCDRFDIPERLRTALAKITT